MKRLLASCCLLPALTAQALDFDVQELVSAHNRWRAAVGVPPLTYSTKLAASAQEWANTLKKEHHCEMQHSVSQGRYGENLYWGSALEWSDGTREVQQVSPATVVDDWASERADYDHASNRCAPGKVCGHYTQVVWRTTTTVGCAIALCEDTSEQVWVCQYQPPGNWVGQKPY
jgi:pathogenesis-related protein 1